MFVNFILSVCSDFSSDAIHTAIGFGIGTLTRRNASSIIRLLSFSREKVKDSLAAVRDKSQPRAERAIRSFKGLSRVDQLYLVGAACRRDGAPHGGPRIAPRRDSRLGDHAL